MNPSYPEVHPEHMPTATGHRPASSDRRYSTYQQPQQLMNSQQPPPPYSQYPQYGYPNGMPPTSAMMTHPVHLPGMYATIFSMTILGAFSGWPLSMTSLYAFPL
jgi:hypothetical protein